MRLFQYNINFKLHRVSNVFRLCKGVNIMMLVCLSPPRIPSARPTGRGGLCSEDQHLGSAAGEPVTAVFEYCDVCDVNMALETFGVSNSGEK